jgi:hypothetical protein
VVGCLHLGIAIGVVGHIGGILEYGQDHFGL